MSDHVLKGKILFVFSDPGGAKPCLSLIETQRLKRVIAISDRDYSFYSNFKTHVIIEKSNFEKIVDDFLPDVIFTGTSYTSDIEQQFIKIAFERNIQCCSFVDHWTSISKRFVDKNGKLLIPDKIWVIDERAMKIAIEEGIDEEKIVISGNPYHVWLKKWQPGITRNEFLSEIGVSDTDKKILVYAPDPLSNVDGINKFGFDELTASRNLGEIFNNNSNVLRDWIVLVKEHPNQNKKKLKEVLNERFRVLPEGTDANKTIYFADAIIGFFSSFLIEAHIMNKPVIRFLNDVSNYDPIAELNIGHIANNKNVVEILKRIQNENK